MKIRSFRPKTQHNLEPRSKNLEMGEQNPRFAPEQVNASQHKVRLVPLGGVGDVTKNMYVYEYGDDIVIIDCGVGFPDEDMLGVDLVIPDISYLKDKKHKIRGILITHAHDDHIGGLPYIWPELNVPIYSQKLTCGLIKAKFTEHNLPKDQIKTVGLSDVVTLGAFKASFYQVSHSIPDSTGIVLQTPVGTLIHQADFKMDWTPVNGQTTDIGTVANLGKKGVLFMTIDCLRVEKSGYTLSERTIEGTFEKVEKETEGKVLITMTSSNITRVQQAINVAGRSGRKLALSGRSVETNFQVARDLGYLQVPPGLVIAQEEIKRFPDNKLLILIAGSQGQPGSALSRTANGDHKFIQLNKKDSVVFSADPIPSTESAQHALIDTLTKLGCNVYYSALTSDLHVSGHAASEELKLMVVLAKPQYILPIGGTYRHMKAFGNLMKDLGYKETSVFDQVTDGEVLEISQKDVKINGKVNASNVYVDGLGVGDVGNVILRDRQVMSEEGVVIVVVPIDRQSGKLAGEPDVLSRGFVFGESGEDLIEAAKEITKSSLAHHKGPIDWRYSRKHIEESLDKFFYEETKRKPLILTVVVEI